MNIFRKQIFKQKLNFIFLNKNFIKQFCEKNVTDLKEKLIKMSLINVSKYGWTETSIKLAANDLGYSNAVSCVLDKGPLDLVYYTLDSWYDKLRDEMQAIRNDKNLTTDEKYKKAIRLRLSYQTPLINTWPQAMKLGMSVDHINTTVNKLLKIVDEISNLEEFDTIAHREQSDVSGSSLMRINSISKRLVILKIYLVTELFMLSDRSYNFEKTWEFLDTAYSINMGIYNSLSKFSNFNSAVLKLIKYSLVSLAPYDFSKIEEIMKMKQDGKYNEPMFSENDKLKV